MKKTKKLPMVHCVMPTTAKRRWCIERAIRCWLAQDYPASRRRLVVIDGPNEPLELPQPHVLEAGPAIATPHVRDLVPKRAGIFYLQLKPGEPGTVGDKYNLGSNLADDDDLIALWADDDWHHPSRISLVVDAMSKAQVDIGGTISMFMYRMIDQKLFLFTYPYSADPIQPAPDAKEANVDIALPYLIGGTMIYSKRRWAAVHGFKPMKSGTDSEFVTRLVMGCEQWDAEAMRIDPQYGDNSVTTNYATTRADGRVYEAAIVQLHEPRIYCAFTHDDNTGNPLKGSAGTTALEKEGVRQLISLGAEHVAALRMRMGAEAEAFLGPVDDKAA